MIYNNDNLIIGYIIIIYRHKSTEITSKRLVPIYRGPSLGYTSLKT